MSAHGSVGCHGSQEVSACPAVDDGVEESLGGDKYGLREREGEREREGGREGGREKKQRKDGGMEGKREGEREREGGREGEREREGGREGEGEREGGRKRGEGGREGGVGGRGREGRGRGSQWSKIVLFKNICLYIFSSCAHNESIVFMVVKNCALKFIIFSDKVNANLWSLRSSHTNCIYKLVPLNTNTLITKFQLKITQF